MKQSEFFRALADDAGYSQGIIEAVMNAQYAVVTDALRAGSEITLPGIGKLTVADRAARTGRNPKTGAELPIPAKRVVTFRPSKAMRDAVR